MRKKMHKCGIYVQMNFCLKDEDYTSLGSSFSGKQYSLVGKRGSSHNTTVSGPVRCVK